MLYYFHKPKQGGCIMMRSIYKKETCKNYEYQEDYRKKLGKKIARGFIRAREKNLWKKEIVLA